MVVSEDPFAMAVKSVYEACDALVAPRHVLIWYDIACVAVFLEMWRLVKVCRHLLPSVPS